jgi:putative CocE/NonD family hydrolase
MRLRVNQPVAMRDGVRLSADLYLPEGDGPFPTVLMRTPYDNSQPGVEQHARRLADAGFAVVTQDARGRFDSEGAYEPFRNEHDDGFDTQQWIGAQPWSTGRIGMTGGSYDGWVQWSSATRGSPHLSAIVPSVMATELHPGLVYRGGALNLGVLLTWGTRTSGRTRQRLDNQDWVEQFRVLPVSEAANAVGTDVPHWRDWIEHEGRDAWWDQLTLDPRFSGARAAALVLGGWYDLYSSDTFTSWEAYRTRGGGDAPASRVIVGPWPHALSLSPVTGGVDFGDGSMLDLATLEVRWFERWLRGVDNGVDREPPVKVFLMGANEWRDSATWPLPGTEPQPWYLHSDGGANTVIGDGRLSPRRPDAHEPADAYVYDPRYPVPTRGGPNCCQPEIIPWGPYDQRDVEMRPDVLVYTSEPLERDLVVAGPIRVVLYASSDAADTDWTAKLVDVRPSGFAMNLCDGIARARWRHGGATPQLLEPGLVERYEIDLMVTGNAFLAGHRIRVEISSSNFPRFDRNANTGALLREASTDLRAARQTVLHTAEHPSHLILPVAPA